MLTTNPHFLERLLRLRMMGFGLAIDDYGTGRSNLQLLSKFGACFTLCGPAMWIPREFEKMGMRVKLTSRIDDALGDADVIIGRSARNRFAGIVTKVVKDKVSAHVEIQAGPHRVVSLMTREAADELGLAPGMLAVAAVKATSVVVEIAAP